MITVCFEKVTDHLVHFITHSDGSQCLLLLHRVRFSSAFVCLCLFYRMIFKNITFTITKLGIEMFYHESWKVETHLFLGQQVKSQGYEAQKTVPAWVFALLLAFSSLVNLFT